MLSMDTLLVQWLKHHMAFMDALLVQWLKSISETQLLEKEDPVYEWRDRIFKQFEDTINKAHTYPV